MSRTGKGADAAKAATISGVASVEASSVTTSSYGRTVWLARLASCSATCLAPLYVAIAIEMQGRAFILDVSNYFGSSSPGRPITLRTYGAAFVATAPSIQTRTLHK